MAFFSAATSNISKSRLLLRLLQYSEKDRARERERLVLRRANNSIHSNPHDWCPLASVGKREKCFGKSSRCLIRGLVRNTKCVSQTHKTWFYYDYTTRHDKPGEARTNKQHKVHIIIWWSNFLQKKKPRKRCVHCCVHTILLFGACSGACQKREKLSPPRIPWWNMIPIISAQGWAVSSCLCAQSREIASLFRSLICRNETNYQLEVRDGEKLPRVQITLIFFPSQPIRRRLKSMTSRSLGKSTALSWSELGFHRIWQEHKKVEIKIPPIFILRCQFHYFQLSHACSFFLLALRDNRIQRNVRDS